jgi:hypothetical protein
MKRTPGMGWGTCAGPGVTVSRIATPEAQQSRAGSEERDNASDQEGDRARFMELSIGWADHRPSS